MCDPTFLENIVTRLFLNVVVLCMVERFLLVVIKIFVTVMEPEELPDENSNAEVSDGFCLLIEVDTTAVYKDSQI